MEWKNWKVYYGMREMSEDENERKEKIVIEKKERWKKIMWKCLSFLFNYNVAFQIYISFNY